MDLDTKQATIQMREFAKKKYQENYSEAIFKKAIEKLKRWMRAAYGGLEWEELNDLTESFDFYYRETSGDTTLGKDTANREGFGVGLRKIKC